MKFLAEPTPHAEALQALAGLPPVDRDSFDQMLPEFQHAAFLITGIWQRDVLQDVKDTLAGAHSGEDWDTVRGKIEKAIEPHLGKQAPRRALMILRSAVYRTSAATVTRQLDNHTAAFPFRKRLSAGDGRVRDSHRAMHGMTLPADSPFWDAHTPPDSHNCRCQVVGVTRLQAQKLRAQEDADVAAGTMKEEERRLAVGPLLKQQEQGIINRGLDQQWNLNKEPGAVAWNPRSLYMPMAQIKQRYSPDEWAGFESFAKRVKPDGNRTLWQELVDQRAGAKPAAGKPIQPALPLPGPLPKPRTREQVVKAISPDVTGDIRAAELAKAKPVPAPKPKTPPPPKPATPPPPPKPQPPAKKMDPVKLQEHAQALRFYDPTLSKEEAAAIAEEIGDKPTIKDGMIQATRNGEPYEVPAEILYPS